MLKDALGGSSTALKGIAPNSICTIAIGYRYSVKTTLSFVMTANAGTTKPGEPYTIKYTDGYGNPCSRVGE